MSCRALVLGGVVFAVFVVLVILWGVAQLSRAGARIITREARAE